MTVYFDNSATTQVLPQAAEKALHLMRTCYGNPSSLHSMGFAAEKAMTAARQAVAEALGALPQEVIFTSGGTESNNLALFGAALAKKRVGTHIVTSAIEHPSVLAAVAELEKGGCSVTRLPPRADGCLDVQQLVKALQPDTILVSLMSINNETGARLPLEAVAPALRKAGSSAIFHVDHVQGFGKHPLHLKRLGIDLCSVSSHKIHGPKGVGGLYVKKGLRILPRSFGGGQEKALRPGTENLPGIGAFGVAAAQMKPDGDKLSALNRQLRQGLEQLGLPINSPDEASPYILNFSAPGIRGETMMHYLAEQGVYLSTGSACSGSHVSPVLTAMGLDKGRVESALRLSLCGQNTGDEAEYFLQTLARGLKALARR